MLPVLHCKLICCKCYPFYIVYLCCKCYPFYIVYLCCKCYPFYIVYLCCKCYLFYIVYLCCKCYPFYIVYLCCKCYPFYIVYLFDVVNVTRFTLYTYCFTLYTYLDGSCYICIASHFIFGVFYVVDRCPFFKDVRYSI